MLFLYFLSLSLDRIHNNNQMTHKNDVNKALQILQSYQRQFLDLETEFKAEVAEIENKIRRNLNDLETITLKLDKKDISVKLLSLTWVPSSNNTT